jgi:hypothetical protein
MFRYRQPPAKNRTLPSVKNAPGMENGKGMDVKEKVTNQQWGLEYEYNPGCAASN